MRDQVVSTYVDRLIALAKGGPKEVERSHRPRVKELREKSGEYFKSARYDEALPLLTELAELTANPVVLTRIARTLKHMQRNKESSRLLAVLRAQPLAGEKPGGQVIKGVPSEPVVATQRANYTDRYGEANCDHLLRINKKNEAAVLNGIVPVAFQRLIPHVPGRKVLEVGAGEGIFSLALAADKERVIGIDMTPVRYEKARELQLAWRKLGRDVDRCEFVLGDIFEHRHLFQGVDTLLACHVIYYFRDRLDEFMKLVRENMRYVCLIGNANRARHYKAGDITRLAGYEYYSTLEGMTDVLERYGFSIIYSSEEWTPIVVGEAKSRAAGDQAQ